MLLRRTLPAITVTLAVFVLVQIAVPLWIRPHPANCMPQAGPANEAEEQACFATLADLGYRQQVTYQPANRFWTFQLYETAMFAILAFLLAGFSFWQIRRLT
jgi:hypothetical protein